MQVHYHRDRHDRLVGIAREASLYEWLIALSRRKRHPPHVPRHLHADLGLPPIHERTWPFVR